MRVSRNARLWMDCSHEPAKERRRHGRLRCDGAQSCIGSILDLSASGLRVERKGRPVLEIGDEFVITVHPEEGEHILSLPSRVVWIQRKGFRKHIYGIEFAPLDEDQQQQIRELARIVCDQIVFRCSSHTN